LLTCGGVGIDYPARGAISLTPWLQPGDPKSELRMEPF